MEDRSERELLTSSLLAVARPLHAPSAKLRGRAAEHAFRLL